MKIIILIILSYLLGSISGSLLIGKFKNIDIRTMGSGNAGGTNALRSVGPLFALGTIIIDVFKGYIPVALFANFIKLNELGFQFNMIDWAPILFGTAAVLGHVYPIYYNFKGGKGAGTLIGVVAAIFPESILYVVLVWIISLVLTGYVGFSTMLAGIALTIYTYFYYINSIFSPFGYFTIGVSMFLIYTHRENIIRMINGQENQFEKVMIVKKIFSKNS
tara:strand:+ start:2202 stop:2858 length:657 start_codon:yes stop_codon:yes gene_type:complete